MDIEFDVVDKSLQTELKSLRGNRFSSQPNPLMEKLIAGETLWLKVADSRKIAGLYQSARRRGFKMTGKKANRNDEIGHLVWWTKPEVEGA